MAISHTQTDPAAHDSFSVGEWVVVPSRNVIARDGIDTRLEPRVMDLLVHLARRAPEAVSKRELADVVWKSEFVSDDVLTVTVSALRKALHDDARRPRYIETISRRGYRMIGAVTFDSSRRSDDETRPAAQTLAAAPSRPRRWPRVLAAAALVLVPLGAARMLTHAPRRRHVASNESHEAYVKGRYFLDQRSVRGWKQALEQFGRAVALDRQDPAAYAGLADAYTAMNDFGVASPAELRPSAMQAAERALALDPMSAEAHEAMARALFLFDWDVAGAERHLAEALAADSEYMPTHQAMAWVESARGRPVPAVAAARKALQLDPVNTARYTELAWVLALAGRHAEAARETDRALQLDPRSINAHLMKGWILQLASQPDSAFDVYLAGMRLAGLPAETLAGAESAFRSGGLAGFFKNWLNQGGGGAQMSETFRAQLYVRAGEPDRAIQSLEQALQKHEAALAWINVEPTLQSLRSDRRFQEIASRVGRF